jgi:short-subunit dehydrogenase
MINHKFKAKNLNQQVIVISGGPNRIGLTTAKLAASAGATVVLATTNQEEIKEMIDEISTTGGKVLAVTTDFTKIDDLINLKNICLERFGHIDTWVNNIGSYNYGYLLDSNKEDEKKIFETNFWSARYGSEVAVHAMEKSGGVLINLGSEVSAAVQPLLGLYSASKQAIKAFTDSLRLELKDKNIPVEVCLLRPANFDSYTKETAAAIIKCAENPQKDIYVGSPTRLSGILDTFFPQVNDMVGVAKMNGLKKSEHHFFNKNHISKFSVFKSIRDNFQSSLKDEIKNGH